MNTYDKEVIENLSEFFNEEDQEVGINSVYKIDNITVQNLLDLEGVVNVSVSKNGYECIITFDDKTSYYVTLSELMEKWLVFKM